MSESVLILRIKLMFTMKGCNPSSRFLSRLHSVNWNSCNMKLLPAQKPGWWITTFRSEHCCDHQNGCRVANRLSCIFVSMQCFVEWIFWLLELWQWSMKTIEIFNFSEVSLAKSRHTTPSSGKRTQASKIVTTIAGANFTGAWMNCSL